MKYIQKKLWNSKNSSIVSMVVISTVQIYPAFGGVFLFVVFMNFIFSIKDVLCLKILWLLTLIL